MSPTGPSAVPFWSREEVEASIAGTIAHLQAGKVLAYPTETVTGSAPPSITTRSSGW